MSRAPVPARAILVSLRPAQWTKNLALLVAPLFAARLGHADTLGAVLVGVASFCLLSSASYLANDLADRERDRLHPEKRRRPIAAGELAPGGAVAGVVVLAGLGLVLARAVSPAFLAVAASYIVLQALYSTVLKHVVILDVFGIAAGFVLRVVAGAEAVAVSISNWLYLCTLLLSLFLALAKRRAELGTLGSDAAQHRRILAEYSEPMLDQLVTILSACTVVAYALYTVAPETVQKFGTDRLKFTVPCVLFGLFRYLYLVHRHGVGEQPEQVLLRDRPTQATLVLYVLLVAWVIYGSPR